ncbi:uncharacterized protein LOC111253185 [Varroa destructor]|uniref:Uncharacterized protein n=1 Tax=Varroa destructor TaxID=109461 RepID=A0A7M7KZN1_VARDE|nr:uncharacterized protein LOC111253185 [Varroa destructor]
MLLLGFLLPAAAALLQFSDTSNCSKYGGLYELVTRIGVVELSIHKNAFCIEKCPSVPQIQNLDSQPTVESASITTARCGLQATGSGYAAILTCTYHNATGHEIKVAHSFPQFREWAKEDPRCVLEGSLITKYSMFSIWLVLKVGIVIFISTVFLAICCLGCCCGWCCCR